MLVSMTGFGRCESTLDGLRVVVEMRSLNNRYLDIFIKMPRKFNTFEDELKHMVRSELSRGKIDVSVNIEGLTDTIEEVSINLPLAKQYFDSIKVLSGQFDQPIELKAENLLTFEGIFERTMSEKQAMTIKKLVSKTLLGALKELKKHKREEGRNLTADCRKRLDRIAAAVKNIRKLVKERHAGDYEHLKKRIVKTLEEVEKVDPRRLEMEAAIMAERFDVSEECVRLESHIKLFKASLQSSGSVGRRLDFILQEINREANTISAKSNNFNISEEVVRIKEEVERLKEQVRNVE